MTSQRRAMDVIAHLTHTITSSCLSEDLVTYNGLGCRHLVLGSRPQHRFVESYEEPTLHHHTANAEPSVCYLTLLGMSFIQQHIIHVQ